MDVYRNKVIAASSLAAHKSASLKAQIMVLGSAVLPVPTVVLNGLTSFKNIYRDSTEFRELVSATFELSISLQQQIILSIGYLYSVEQIKAIEECISKYRSCIYSIVLDPISGDNDNTYVKDEIIEALPILFQYADWIIPNTTEVKFFSAIHYNNIINEHILAFFERFNPKNLIVTSYREKSRIGVKACLNGNLFEYLKPELKVKMDGSGDFFMAYFIRNKFYELLEDKKAIKRSVNQVYNWLSQSLKNKYDEIIHFV
jgi:pyridoxal/pyridoxine/pyridoxamine kinase